MAGQKGYYLNKYYTIVDTKQICAQGIIEFVSELYVHLQAGWDYSHKDEHFPWEGMGGTYNVTLVRYERRSRDKKRDEEDKLLLQRADSSYGIAISEAEEGEPASRRVLRRTRKDVHTAIERREWTEARKAKREAGKESAVEASLTTDIIPVDDELKDIET